MSKPLVDVVCKASHDAIHAGQSCIWQGCFQVNWFQVQAEAVLAAVRPLIEAEERARARESLCHHHWRGQFDSEPEDEHICCRPRGHMGEHVCVGCDARGAQ